MKLCLSDRIKQLNKSHRNKKSWQKVLAVLCAIVVFCTTYSLILPAITMTDKTNCNMTEHIHTDDCYTQSLALICEIEETDGYSHTDDCYKEKELIVCGKTECEKHKHNDKCYNDDEKLTCKKDETDGHKHTDDCRTKEKILICTKEEIEAHHHTDECYEATKTLICKESEHNHNAECYSKDNHEEVSTEADDDVITKSDNTINTVQSNALNSDTVAPDGTHDRLYSDVYMYYEYPPYELEYFDTLTNSNSKTTGCTFVLVPVEEQSYKWTPNPASGWTSECESNYDVAYCADIDVYTSADGDVYYDSMPIAQTNVFTDEQKRKLTAIVQNAYPFIPAEQALQNIRDAGYTLSDNCSLAELVIATQWAIWEVTNNSTIYGCKSAVTWNLSSSVKDVTINPLVNATPFGTGVQQDTQAIRDYLASRTANIKENLIIASKEITDIIQNSDGTYSITVKVSLNRALTSDESAYITITDSDSNTNTITVPHNITSFEITLDNISEDVKNITIDLNGSTTETYLSPVFYQSDEYQNMVGAKPITATYSDKALLSFGAETNVSVKKEWVGDEGADSVNVTLFANNQQYGDAVTLNSDNNWSYKWENLPTGTLTEKITYTVKEAPVPGYYSEVTYKDVENKTVLQNWTEASQLQDGKTYMFVSSSGALSSKNNSSGNIQLSNVDITSVTSDQTPSMWTATKTTDGFKLTNKQSGKNLAVIYSSWSYRFFEKATNTSQYSDTINFSAGKLSAKYNNTTYYLSTMNSGGYASSNTSSSSASSFTLYELEEESKTSNDLEATVTNTKADEVTSIVASKQWKASNGTQLDDTPEYVTVRLYANGEEYGEAVILDNKNGWLYEWKNLPLKDNNDNTIEYTVQEDDIEGFTPTISAQETENTIIENVWQSATSLEDGKTYLFVSNGKALSKTNADDDLLELSDIDITDTSNTSGLSMWTATKSGSGFKLTNIAKSDRTLALYSKRVFFSTTRRFVAANSSSSDINTRELTYSNGYISASGYQFGSISSGYGSASSSSGTSFELYEFAEVETTERQTVYTITNTEQAKTVAMSFTKTDFEDTSNLLSNSVFDLYRETENQSDTLIPLTENIYGVRVFNGITTDLNGHISVDGLSENTAYYLVETKSPQGYTKLTKPIKFILTNGGISIDSSDMALDASSNGEYVLLVKNRIGYTLPETGGKGANLITFIGLALITSALLLLNIKYYKNRRLSK